MTRSLFTNTDVPASTYTATGAFGVITPTVEGRLVGDVTVTSITGSLDLVLQELRGKTWIDTNHVQRITAPGAHSFDFGFYGANQRRWNVLSITSATFEITTQQGGTAPTVRTAFFRTINPTAANSQASINIEGCRTFSYMAKCLTTGVPGSTLYASWSPHNVYNDSVSVAGGIISPVASSPQGAGPLNVSGAWLHLATLSAGGGAVLDYVYVRASS